jgi:uncharacterized protein YjiS (DUF1127 family)
MSLISLNRPVRSRTYPNWNELKALFVEWQHRIRSRWELQMLKDYELRDIGLTRATVDNECEKPFWRA